MREVAKDVFLLSGFPPCGFNIFLIRNGARWILVDTASRHALRRILRQLPGALEAVFITHAHHDHAGAMHAVAMETDAPVWAHPLDVDALEGRVPEPLPESGRSHPMNRMASSWWKEPHPVGRQVDEGDPVGDFRVVALRGHTPGHIGLWRETDRTLICGDAMRSVHLLTGIPQLGEMPDYFTVDKSESRRSIHKMVDLEPETVLFGHGRPITRDTTARLARFAKRMRD